ncbi:helix-turn-helix domain-containing protein [Pectobacterium versatile]|uniref:helix-turn-helix domain-containing protein n=1 Tax=Pectobacterium versatile TaxID=2488639 RepID=UPI001CCBFAE3|nr:Mor transcription activator family protein [Pectobacterium versatile]
MSYKESTALNDFFYGLDIKKLPDQFQELIDIMGLEDAYIFSQLFGGQCKYIPKSPKCFCVDINGRAVERLCQEFGGLSIDVPHAKNIDRQLRNREIINLLDRGKSRTEVAKIYNLGVRQVANIKKTVCK